jgi:DNA-3-methyladenine glycosylase II
VIRPDRLGDEDMSARHEHTARYASEVETLAKRDRVLEEIVRRVGPCTLAPSTNHFLTLFQAIVWQQLSWKSACAIHAKVLEAMGTRRPRPSDVCGASDRALAKAGLSRQKTRYVKELARYFEEGRFPARTIQRCTDGEIIRMLTEIKGVGQWTAEMYLIFGLNRLDVFPAGDLGLKKAIGRHYGFDGLHTPERLEAVTGRWRPYRTIGTWYMWSSADATPLADRSSHERT